MEVENTLAYYDTATIAAVKSFIVQAPRCWSGYSQAFKKLGRCHLKKLA
jgi:hypothetical protein